MDGGRDADAEQGLLSKDFGLNIPDSSECVRNTYTYTYTCIYIYIWVHRYIGIYVYRYIGA